MFVCSYLISATAIQSSIQLVLLSSSLVSMCLLMILLKLRLMPVRFFDWPSCLASRVISCLHSNYQETHTWLNVVYNIMYTQTIIENQKWFRKSTKTHTKYTYTRATFNRIRNHAKCTHLFLIILTDFDCHINRKAKYSQLQFARTSSNSNIRFVHCTTL